MVVLALDYGEKRLGLAITSDEQTTLPLARLSYQNESELLRRLTQVCQEYQVGRLVVGLPLTAAGAVGEAAQRIVRFARKLGCKLNLPVSFVNERLTTYAAQQKSKDLKQQGIKEPPTDDSLAAQFILQDYLESLK